MGKLVRPRRSILMARRLLTVGIMAMVVHLVTAAISVAATDPRASAHEHFERGLAAFRQERFAEAAEEFEEAYRISPSFRVLYNIGQVDVALGRSVEAVEAYEKFLNDGGTRIPAERQKEVREALAKEQARIGGITVRTEPDGAEIRLDGRLVGTTPLTRPIRATVGAHTIEVSLSGRPTRVREVKVAGGGEIDIEIEIKAVVAPDASKVAPVGSAVKASPREPTKTAEAIAVPPAPVAVQSTREVRSAARDEGGGWTKPVGFVLGVAGLAGAATGGILAAAGASSANSAVDRFTNANCPAAYIASKCDGPTNDYNAGKDLYRVGWWIAGAGTAVLAAGAVLVLAAPERHSSQLGAASRSWVAFSPSGLSLGGSW
jgi:hypothetical protein